MLFGFHDLYTVARWKVQHESGHTSHHLWKNGTLASGRFGSCGCNTGRRHTIFHDKPEEEKPEAAVLDLLSGICSSCRPHTRCALKKLADFELTHSPPSMRKRLSEEVQLAGAPRRREWLCLGPPDPTRKTEYRAECSECPQPQVSTVEACHTV